MQVKRGPKGNKLWQRKESKEDRLFDYRVWRQEKLSHIGFVTDIDQCEWRRIDGSNEVVSLFEMTRPDTKLSSSPSGYLYKIWERYWVTQRQGHLARFLANRLGSLAYCVCYDPDLKRFFIMDLLQKGIEEMRNMRKCWKEVNEVEYEAFLDDLPKRWKEVSPYAVGRN